MLKAVGVDCQPSVSSRELWSAIAFQRDPGRQMIRELLQAMVRARNASTPEPTTTTRRPCSCASCDLRPRSVPPCSSLPLFKPCLPFILWFSCVRCAVDHQFRGKLSFVHSLAQERGPRAVARCGLELVGCCVIILSTCEGGGCRTSANSSRVRHVHLFLTDGQAPVILIFDSSSFLRTVHILPPGRYFSPFIRHLQEQGAGFSYRAVAPDIRREISIARTLGAYIHSRWKDSGRSKRLHQHRNDAYADIIQVVSPTRPNARWIASLAELVTVRCIT